jgi:hypothetical protein
MQVRRGRARRNLIAVACLALFGSQTAQAQVKLQYKFPEGKTLTYRTNSNSFQTISLMGMEIQSRENKTVVLTQAIGKRREDSSLPVEVKVRSLRADLGFHGGTRLTYDSTKPDARIDNPEFVPLIDLYKLESAVAYTVVLDGRGKVKAIEGTEPLQAKSAGFDAIAREQIRSRIEPDRLKAQFEQEHHNLPDDAARPGDSWERTEVLDFGGQALSFRKKYEYAGTEKRGGKTLDKITCKVLEAKCLPDSKAASPLRVTKSDLKVDSSEGTVFFDRDAGCLVESRERTKVQGTMTFSGGGADTSSRTELTLQSNTQLQPQAK